MQFDENGFDGAGWHKLHSAAIDGDVKAMQNELDKKVNIDIENRLGSSPLHIAVGCKQEDAVTFLLSKGANVNKQNFIKDTALTLAAYCFDGETILKTLLEAKADLTIRGDQGKTALEWAEIRGRDTAAEIIKDFQNIQAAPVAPPAPNPFLSSGLKSAT